MCFELCLISSSNYPLFVFFRNLRFAIRDPRKSDGIYLVDPLADRTNLRKSKQPAKLLSVEGLKKALRFVLVILVYSYALFWSIMNMFYLAAKKNMSMI